MCKVRCLKLVHHVQGHARPGATARLAALEMKHTQVTQNRTQIFEVCASHGSCKVKGPMVRLSVALELKDIFA